MVYSMMRYVPILKTRDAELRGIENLAEDVKDAITPLWELTRSRRTKKDQDGKLQRRLEQVARAFGVQREFGLDITSHIDLQNKEIIRLFQQHDSYNAWVVFLEQQKISFPRLIPTLLMSDDGLEADQYIKVHKKEISKLHKSFDQYIYRVNFDYDDLEFDMNGVFGNSLLPIALLDMEYIPQGREKRYTERAIEKIKVLADAGIEKIILAGSSFPKSPTDGGGDTQGEHRCIEIDIYNNCKKKFPNLIYGDYATIYPLPNERAGGQGWVPRIDFPVLYSKEDSISIRYHRDRKAKNEKSYSSAYIRVAKEVFKDEKFGKLRKQLGDNNWGIYQIWMASEGYPPALNPSFWISVRINLYIALQHSFLIEKSRRGYFK